PDGRREVFDYYDTAGIAPAANGVSSVRDLARFASIQFREEAPAAAPVVLRRSTVLEMHRPHWVNESWSGGRGLGFSISRKDGKTFVSHGGWIGGNRSHFLLVPAEKIAVIAITNADDGDPGRFTSRAYDLLAPALEEAFKVGRPAPGQRVPDPTWQAYLGRYTDPWHWEYQVMILDGELVMYGHNYPPDDDPRGDLDRLVPVAEHTFLLGDGELVVFEMREDGRVERIRRRYEILLPISAQE
ncbi:MAG: serine hydrolase, partial [Acidobacteria bacterium]|nr:serine hydrolase [Acidobacteriota bacterium]